MIRDGAAASIQQGEPMGRCAWAGTDPLMVAYHDEEWGVPVHDDRKLFEFLVLDAFQAGLGAGSPAGGRWDRAQSPEG